MTAPIEDLLRMVSDDFVRSLGFQRSVPMDDKVSKILSARQWGNTLVACHRPFPHDEIEDSGLKFELLGRIEPTDVRGTMTHTPQLFAYQSRSTLSHIIFN